MHRGRVSSPTKQPCPNCA